MPEKIQDGTGKGYLARVNEEHSLAIEGHVSTEEHKVSSNDKLAFFATTATVAKPFLTTTATGGHILYVENGHTTKQLVIEKILLSTDVDDIQMVWYRNPTVASIANNTTVVPANLNFSSSLAAIGTFYGWDEVGDGMTTFTDGTIVNAFMKAQGFTPFPIDGAIILERGNGLSVWVKGAAEVCVGIRMFYRNKEI